MTLLFVEEDHSQPMGQGNGWVHLADGGDEDGW
jgi:hypothetical protein